jgi:hypothetical protein
LENKKETLKNRVKQELLIYWGYSLFLAFFITVFTLYRQLVLDEYSLSTYKYGYGIIEALILAKVIMIGQAFGLGQRLFRDCSLIIPTLYKTGIFSLFVLFFSVLEHFVLGYFAGEKMDVIYHKIMNVGIYEILARVLIMAFVFFFFFAFLELGRVLGETKLFNLFFRRNKAG